MPAYRKAKCITEKKNMNMDKKRIEHGPTLSVIIPIYKCEPYIDECLTSVLSQDFTDYEILCVYDGERVDGSGAQKYSSDSRIKLIEKEHGGLSDTRNVGYNNCIGKYIYYLDSDDYLAPNSFSKMIDQMDYFDLDILCFDAKTFVDGKDAEIQNRYGRDLKVKGVVNGKLLLNVMINNDSFRSPVWLFCIRKSFYDEHGFSFEKGVLHEDELFTYQCMMLAKRTKWIPDQINQHRVRADSIMGATVSHKNFDGYLHVYLGMLKFNIKNDIDATFSSRFLYRMRKLALKTYGSLSNDEKLKVAPLDEDSLKILSSNAEDLAEIFKKRNKQYQLSGIIESYQSKISHPAISIIMPVYNSSRYLRQALDDIFNQSVQSFELICVDDGSSDNSLSILEQYARQYDNMYILPQKNRHAGAARNFGMSVARGDYLIFLDSDDRFDERMLEYALDSLLVNESDLVMFEADIFDNISGKTICAPWLMRPEISDSAFNPKSKKNLFQITTGNPWNKMFKSSYIRELNLKFQILPRSNDLFFVYTAMANASKISLVHEVLIHYRKNNPLSLQGTNTKTPLAFYHALYGLKKRLVADNLYEIYKQTFINLCVRNIINNIKSVHSLKSISAIFLHLKWHILSDLDIKGIDEDSYYNKEDYIELRRIMTITLFSYLKERAKVNEVGYIEAIKRYCRRE